MKKKAKPPMKKAPKSKKKPGKGEDDKEFDGGDEKDESEYIAEPARGRGRGQGRGRGRGNGSAVKKVIQKKDRKGTKCERIG